MFDWLFEGNFLVYALLGSAALLLMWAWWTTRQRPYLIGWIVTFALIFAYAALDRLVETNREQIQRKLQEMAHGVQAKKLDAVFQHISERFATPHGRSKQEFRDLAQAYLDSGEVEGIKLSDVQFEQAPSEGNGKAVVSFLANIWGHFGGSEQVLYRCEATFRLDPDGQWRLLGFKLFPPTSTQEMVVPL